MISQRKAVAFLAVAGLFLSMTGCVSTSLTADVDPQVELGALRSFVVVKFGPDSRGVEQLIAAELNSRGKQATAVASQPDQVAADAVVTYVDKWMWDITMYMIELTIEVRDPETNYKLASARSYRTSLARKSPREMVSEVLGKMFDE